MCPALCGQDIQEYAENFRWKCEKDGILHGKPENIEICQQFHKFATSEQAHSHWCPDVLVLNAWCQACLRDELIISVMLADLRTRNVPFAWDESYETYLPDTSEFVAYLYLHVHDYLQLLKFDLQRIGCWDSRCMQSLANGLRARVGSRCVMRVPCKVGAAGRKGC